MDPYPGAWTLLDGKELKIYACIPVESSHTCRPGAYFSNQKDIFRYFTRDGYIEIKTIKLAGKRKMEVKDFLNGYELAKSTLAN
jgi:methionyl-tRNA formyltransferase